MKINFNCYRAYFQQGIVFILYAFYPLMSADSGLGTISGRVYNIVGAPVADVHVLLENNSGADVSNSGGEFAVTDIAPGIYTISFSHISYNPYTLEGIEVIEGQETRLDPVILTARIFNASAISVTATRMDIEKEKYTSQINVVTNKKINALQPKTSAEALREEPGISIQKTNHGGGSANIRGLSSNQILLMVDGVRLNNSTYRRGNHQYLTTVDYQMTAQMEIIKGPSSVIHGSDALGGTINIVTKEPELSSAGFEWQLRGNVRYATADNERLLRLEPVLKNERWVWQAGLSLKSFGDLRRGKNSKYPVLENATDGLYQRPTGFDAWDIDSKIMFSFVPGQSLALAYQKTTQMDGIPPFFGLFGLVLEKPDFRISLYTRFAGSQSRLSSDDKDDPRIPPGGTPGWSIINIRGLYRINSYLRVTCVLENILDLNYREHGSGINGPGRNLVFSGELLL
jgi:outer membrane receptor protein involved in Fe transport